MFKNTLFVLALFVLALIGLPICSLAASIPVELTVVTGVTGQASSIRVVAYDSQHNVITAATNTPDGTHAFIEDTNSPGTYYAPYNLDSTKLPIKVQPLPLAQSSGTQSFTASTYGVDRAAQIGDGYTSGLPGTISTINTQTTPSAQQSNGASSLANYGAATGTQVASVGTTATGIKSKTDLIGTNTADSPNAATAQANAASAAASGTTATTGAGVHIASGQSVASVTNAVVLPANAPSTFLANETTVQGLGTGIGTLSTGIGALSTKMGAPVGADLAHDIAAVQSGVTAANTLVGALPNTASISAATVTALKADSQWTQVLTQVSKIYGAEWGAVTKNSDGSYSVLAPGTTTIIGTVRPVYSGTILQSNIKVVN